MNWLEYLFDTKILIGFGVGVLTASLCLIPTLKEQTQENAQNSKMKLSTKSLPSTQDLKQVYIKKNEKHQCQTNSTSNDGKKQNQNSNKTEVNQQDFFNLDDGIRKKRKLQESDEESSPRDHQSSQSFNDNQGSQNIIQQNNIINQNETDQFSKQELEDPQSSGKQENKQPLEKVKENDDQLDSKISDQKGEEQKEQQK